MRNDLTWETGSLKEQINGRQLYNAVAVLWFLPLQMLRQPEKSVLGFPALEEP